VQDNPYPAQKPKSPLVQWPWGRLALAVVFGAALGAAVMPAEYGSEQLPMRAIGFDDGDRPSSSFENKPQLGRSTGPTVVPESGLPSFFVDSVADVEADMAFEKQTRILGRGAVPRGVILRRAALRPGGVLASPSEPRAQGKFLFTADDGAAYFVDRSLTPEAARERYREGWTVFENALGKLQAMPQRPLDPSAALQWHNFSWPSLLLDRFPLTLDQNVAGLRARRVDEFLFWSRRDIALGGGRSDDAAPACPAHQPSTLNVNRMWGYFEDDAYLAGRVALQDGAMDSRHPDLDDAAAGISVDRQREVGAQGDLLLSLHGTHVAGVMAARRNDFGVTGVAPGLRIEHFALPARDEGFGVELADALEGLARIERRVSNDSAVRVVLLAYAFEDDAPLLTARGTPLRDALEKLIRHDVVVVVPAGNGTIARRNSAVLPAALTPLLEGQRGLVVPVSATDICSERAWFSRLSPLASGTLLFAPGERIFSTFPGGDYGSLSGTSQAAAQVAAVVALGAHVAPSVPARVLIETLIRTAQPLSHISGRALMPDSWSFLQGLEQAQSRAQRSH
jgi:hypothetical protein